MFFGLYILNPDRAESANGAKSPSKCPARTSVTSSAGKPCSQERRRPNKQTAVTSTPHHTLARSIGQKTWSLGGPI